MKNLLFFSLLSSANLFSQTLTEINFSNRIPEWNSHLTGQFRAVTNSEEGSIVFAASSNGGIFRSTDNGVNFEYLRNFPASGTLCIRYVERSTPVLVVAVEDWWQADDRKSFVWISTDRGDTWTKSRVAAVPAGYSVYPGEVTRAYDIDYNTAADIIFLATDYGLLQSTDGGVSFSYRERPSAMPSAYRIGPAMVSVECGTGSNVYMTGASGFYHSADNGLNWERFNLPATAVSSVAREKNSISVVPTTGTVLLLTSKNTTASSGFAEEYCSYSVDNGRTWANLPTTPVGDGGCGGVPSIRCKRKITRDGDSCVVYISNRCNFFKKSFRMRPDNTVDFSNPAAWTMLNHFHADTHELTFRFESSGADAPRYMSTDGGLHKAATMTDFPLISGPHKGLNALLIYDMAGQLTRAPGGSYNNILYYGTQDNNLGYWDDAVRPYTSYPVVGAEGRGLSAGPFGGAITYTAGSPYNIFQSSTLFRDIRYFTNCPGNIWWPFHIKDGCYVQLGTPPGSAPGTVGLYLTRNNGRRWWLIYSKTGESARLPKVIRTGDNTAMIHMPVHDESGNQVFVKIVADVTSFYFPIIGDDLFPPFVYAIMPSFNNFGGFGYQQWEIPVFAVNPANPEHILAPDMESNTLKQSLDGGNNWTEIPGITNRVLAEGRYKFKKQSVVSFISSVAFSPSGGTMIVGTTLNGIFYSRSRGAAWDKIPGSESMKHIYQPYFKPVVSTSEEFEEIFFPTHGRGIWKVQLPWRPLYYIPGPHMDWTYNLRLPPAMGSLTTTAQMITLQEKGMKIDDLILFHPDSVRSVNNTPNGIVVQLAEHSQLHSGVAGFVPLNQSELPSLAYSKKGMKFPSIIYPPGGEKITGVAVSGKKIIALVMAKEESPFFLAPKQTATILAKKNPVYDAQKLNKYQNRFFVSEITNTKVAVSGKRLQLVCCNPDTKNGTRKEWTVFLDNKPWTNFTVNNPSGCTTIPLPAITLPVGKYQFEIRPVNSQEIVGTAFFEVRPADKK